MRTVSTAWWASPGSSGASGATTVFDPANDSTFPAGMSISRNRTPQWTNDRAGLLFGIHTPKAKSDKGDDKKEGDAPADGPPAGAGARPGAAAATDDTPDLVLWHWKDARLQSQQQVQEQRDRRFSFLATYRVASKQFIRLADEEMRDITLPDRGRYAIGHRSARRGRSSARSRAATSRMCMRWISRPARGRSRASRCAGRTRRHPTARAGCSMTMGSYFVHDLAANTSKNITLRPAGVVRGRRRRSQRRQATGEPGGMVERRPARAAQRRVGRVAGAGRRRAGGEPDGERPQGRHPLSAPLRARSRREGDRPGQGAVFRCLRRAHQEGRDRPRRRRQARRRGPGMGRRRLRPAPEGRARRSLRVDEGVGHGLRRHPRV